MTGKEVMGFAVALFVPIAAYFSARLGVRGNAPKVTADATATTAVALKTGKETDGVIVTNTAALIAAQQDVVESVREDNARLKAEMAEVRTEMASLRSEMRAAVGARDKRIDTLTRHVDVLEAAIRTLGGVIPARPF